MKNKVCLKYLTSLILLITINSFSQTKSELKVYFDFDKSEISQVSKTTLDSLVNVLNKYNKYLLEIEGYTDPKGSQNYNQNLAKLRADEVFKFLKNKQINSDYFGYVGVGRNDNNINPNDQKQRNTTIKILLNNLDKFYQEQSYFGKDGTIVTTNVKTGSDINIEVNEIFSSKSMIENEMYAIDTDGNILESAGMIKIFADKEPCKNIENEFDVKIPIQKGQEFDDEMSVWEDALDINGKKGWKETKLKPKLDSTGKYYVFKIPCTFFNSRTGCASINLDKRGGLLGKNYKQRYEPVYISIFKGFKFTDVSLSGLKFSAKINDSLYVFLKPVDSSIRKLQFNGYFENNETNKDYLVFEAKISDCIFSKYKKKFKQYTVCETCYYKFEGKQYNKVVEEKKKGFFEWLKNLFRKKKQ